MPQLGKGSIDGGRSSRSVAQISQQLNNAPPALPSKRGRLASKPGEAMNRRRNYRHSMMSCIATNRSKTKQTDDMLGAMTPRSLLDGIPYTPDQALDMHARHAEVTS